jgi:hypothetical protein
MRKLVYRLVSLAFMIGLYVLVFHGAAPGRSSSSERPLLCTTW